MISPVEASCIFIEDAYWEMRRKLRRTFFQLQNLFKHDHDGVSRLAKANSGSERMLYIDLTVIHANDAGTGIQRVVRALALALFRQPLDGWKIEFVGATRKRPYRPISWPNRAGTQVRMPIVAKPGDIFLGLDYSLDTVRRHWPQLAAFKRNGGTLWFLIHDLLPVQRPDWFSRQAVRRYRAWLDILAYIADGFLCNSAQTEKDLLTELGTVAIRASTPATAVLPMGHDILESNDDHVLRASEGADVESLFAGRKFLLTVGTIEPRKGHADLLRAFDILWSRGFDRDLVLVGRLGWHVEDLRHSIVSHPEFGKKLFWLNDADDVMLLAIYKASIGIIIPSHGEGFGLPLIEALGHRKPVLARDLPIFRCHEKNGVCFFPADARPATIAYEIGDWAKRVDQGLVNVVPPHATWEDSAHALMQAIGIKTDRAS